MANNTENLNSVEHGKQKRKQNSTDAKVEDKKIFSSKVKQDILGVLLIVFAFILFAILLVQTNAPISNILSSTLKFIFGVGVYILPFLLIILGISFFLHMLKQKITLKLTIGFLLIYPSVLTLISVACPSISSSHYEQLFVLDNIYNYGGIIGSSIAWLICTLFGSLVTIIIMIGIIIIGFIILGFSISKSIVRIKQKRDDIDSLRLCDAMQNNNEHNNNNKLIHAPNLKNPNIVDNKHIENIKNDEEIFKTKKIEDESINPEDLTFDATDISNNSNLDDSNSTKKIEIKKELEESTKTKKITSNNQSSSAISNLIPSEDFSLPSLTLLNQQNSKYDYKNDENTYKTTAVNLEKTLNDFNIEAHVVGWVAGPTVTLFKVDLPSGIRVSKITSLNDDIALSLASSGVRVFAPIPGTTYVGIEVPNKHRQSVLLSEVLPYAKSGPLMMAIGRDIEGNNIITDLSTMPHLLIGGTTGSGKSVSINAMIMSIVMRSTPAEVRMILIDPKRVEFTPYDNIPHLLVPVVTDPQKAASALSWGVAEMERRLILFSKVGVRNIVNFNKFVLNNKDNNNKDPDIKQLPYIVIIIDELADLMMANGKEVEYSISRIAQLARAAGIHLIVATQRPSTNVVTGLIKANITNRIAFNVASGIDSRVILDTGGAETLIGLGDMLFIKPEFQKPLRLQGCYVSEEEIFKVVEHLKNQSNPDYEEDILKTNLISINKSGTLDKSSKSSDSDDDLIWNAADMVVSSGYGSTSAIQRRFKVGYARAGRIMDMLEEKGIVGPANGSKPRDVLIDLVELEALKARHDYEDK